MIGGDDWIKKRVDYLCYIEGKSTMKDIHWYTLNAALNVALFYNLFLSKVGYYKLYKLLHGDGNRGRDIEGW